MSKTTKPGRPYAGGPRPQRQYRMADEDYELIRRAAKADGKTLSEWIREVLLRAARRKLS